MAESSNPKRSFSENNDDDNHKASFHFDFAKHLSPQDATLVTNFISKYSDGLFGVSSYAEGVTAYGALAKLLGLLKRHSMLQIIDSKSSEFLELLRIVRRFSCEGKTSWLDALEETVRGNSHVDASSVRALEIEECTLDLLVGSETRWLSEWLQKFMDNIIILKDRLKNMRDRKKFLFEARGIMRFKHKF